MDDDGLNIEVIRSAYVAEGTRLTWQKRDDDFRRFMTERDTRIRAEGYADAAWDEVAQCRVEDRSHGLLCTCFGPLSHPADEIRGAYRTSVIANRLPSNSRQENDHD